MSYDTLLATERLVSVLEQEHTLSDGQKSLCQRIRTNLRPLTDQIRLLQVARREEKGRLWQRVETRFVEALQQGLQEYQQHQLQSHSMVQRWHRLRQWLENPTTPPRNTATPQTETPAYLRVHQHSTDDAETECSICRANLDTGTVVAITTCCAAHVMHANCAIQCLRRDDRCPFCRSRRISFQNNSAS